MPSITRRQAVAKISSLVAVTGCIGRGKSNPQEDTNEEMSTTETPPPSPTAEIATVDSYPFNFEQTVTFDRTDIYGWFFDGSFTKAVDLALNVESGSSISVYLTEKNLQQGKIPDSSVKKKKKKKGMQNPSLGKASR